MQGARRVTIDAYVLRNSRLIDALELAAERGARVTVRLGDPELPSQRAANVDAMHQLSSHGVDVVLEPGYGPRALHDKVAIVDGVLFRDDRNWTTGEWETVLVGAQSSTRRLTLSKKEALAMEASLIRHGKGGDIIVSTESLGPGQIVDALVERAKHGDRVRLLYSPRTTDVGRVDALRRLRAAGVKVRRSCADHKICVVGDRAWIGSANATAGASSLREWGSLVRGLVSSQLRRTLEHVWEMSKG